jgi:polar amino acid transport system substrate-binding protein
VRTTIRLAALPLVAILVAACSAGASPSPVPASPSASAAPSESAATPSPTPDPCAKEGLALVTPGTLTIGTDNPAYPPFFLPREGGNTPPWQGDFVGDPTTGEGFESAVAYAVAARLGFTRDEVAWIPVKFDNAYAPGAKPFDFDINQVSYKAERTQTADLSDGYYSLSQSLVAVNGTPIASAKSIADLKSYQFGAQAGTTSYDAIVNVIKPEKDPRVYDTNDAAIEALKNKQIDGLVVDLPTAFFITAVQLDDGAIVGQFPPTGGEQEHYSLVLAKGSPLTACVNLAIAALTADGTLAGITQEWLADKANAPVLQP